MRERLSAPVVVDFNITKKCNLKCGFCYADAKNNCQQELSVLEIQKLLDEFQELNIHVIRISGGEPFCHSEIKKIIGLLGKYHFVVCMNTNGTMISEEVANLLAESKISRVAVSVDSCNPALHEKMRGVKGCFQHTYKAIDWLLEKCPEKLYITCTLTALNCDVESVMNIIEWCSMKKIRHLSFQVTADVGRCVDKKNLLMSQAQWNTVFGFLTKMRGEEKKLFPEISVNPTNESPVFYQYYYPLKNMGELNLLENIWGQKLEEKVEYISCVGGNISVAIDSNGDVYPCELMFGRKECVVGNIREKKFKELWDSASLFDEIYNKKKKDLNGKCSACENKFCGGGCRATALNETEDIWGSENGCPYEK